MQRTNTKKIFFFTVAILMAVMILVFVRLSVFRTKAVDGYTISSDQTIKLVIGIMSVSAAKTERMWIRNTWLRYPNIGKNHSVEAYFVIANPISEETKLEAKEYGDLLFLDIKENMNAGKTYYWFKYAAQAFSYANYVAKVDMDSYIRTVYMENELNCCMPRKKLMWGITMNVPDHFARKYVGGMAEVLSMDLAVFLSKSSQIEKDLVGPEDLMLGKWFADLDFPMGVMHDSRFHDLPGRGSNAREVTDSSICMHQLTTKEDYEKLYAQFPQG